MHGAGIELPGCEDVLKDRMRVLLLLTALVLCQEMLGAYDGCFGMIFARLVRVSQSFVQPPFFVRMCGLPWTCLAGGSVLKERRDARSESVRLPW